MIESTNKIKNNPEILFMYLPCTSSTAIKLIPSIDLQCKTFRDRFTSFKLPRQGYLNFCCPLEKSRNMHVYVRIEMYFKMAIYALLGTVQKKIQLQARRPARPFLGRKHLPWPPRGRMRGRMWEGCGTLARADRIGRMDPIQPNPLGTLMRIHISY